MLPSREQAIRQATLASQEKRDEQLEVAKRLHAIDAKYKSIDSLSESLKVQRLSRPDVSPFEIAFQRDPKDPKNVIPRNGYDGLMVAFNRWKPIANDAYMSKLSDQQKTKVASDYYDDVIVHMYQAMGVQPMDKGLWLRQAYKEAVNFDMKNGYDNSVLHDLKNGWNSGLPAVARMGESIYNIFTNVGSALAVPKADWTDPKGSLHMGQLLDASNPSSFVNRGSRMQQDNHQFWADALPMKGGWFAHASGYSAELASSLPGYLALGAIPVLGEETVSERLLASPIGKRVFGYLMAGAEGTAYGVLTRPKEDKSEAWKDTLAFIILHGAFDLGGQTLGYTGTKIKGTTVGNVPVPLMAGGRATLSDVLTSLKGKESVEMIALKRRQDVAELGMKGQRLATEAEHYEQLKKEHATNIGMFGVDGQERIYTQATNHLVGMDGAGHTKEETDLIEQKLLKEDPAKWSPVLAAANNLRNLLGGRKIADLFNDQALQQRVANAVNKLIVDSTAEVQKHVPEIAQQGAAEAVERSAKTPNGGPTLDYYRRKVQEEVQTSGAGKMVTPEQIEKQAKALWTKAVERARQRAAEVIASDPEGEVAKAVAPEAKTVAKATAPSAKLNPYRNTPPSLRLSKPRYSYGSDQFELDFEDPADKAAYILANQGKSKAHAGILDYYLKDHPGATSDAVLEHGRRVRDSIKKQVEAGAEPGSKLKVQSTKSGTAPAPKPKPVPALKVRSERVAANPKDVYVRYSVTPDYKVYLQKQAKEAGIPSINSVKFSNWLSSHYDGMEDSDFANHVQDNFYPKALKQAQVWFERTWEKQLGPTHPNFLAFMYNYKDKMPLEMERELEDRLVSTKKFQDAFRGGGKTQPILDFYSQSMYNHVDDFISSGRWPVETNLFRSSNEGVRAATKYQKELLRERNVEELQRLNESFPPNSEARAIAAEHLQNLQVQRMKAFLQSYDEDPNSRKTVQELNKLITQEITKQGIYKKWEF